MSILGGHKRWLVSLHNSFLGIGQCVGLEDQLYTQAEQSAQRFRVSAKISLPPSS